MTWAAEKAAAVLADLVAAWAVEQWLHGRKGSGGAGSSGGMGSGTAGGGKDMGSRDMGGDVGGLATARASARKIVEYWRRRGGAGGVWRGRRGVADRAAGACYRDSATYP